MSLKGLKRRVGKRVMRVIDGPNSIRSLKTKGNITRYALDRKQSTETRQRKVDKRSQKLYDIQVKDSTTGGAVALAGLGAASYGMHKQAQKRREGKTIKGRIKKAIGR